MAMVLERESQRLFRKKKKKTEQGGRGKRGFNFRISPHKSYQFFPTIIPHAFLISPVDYALRILHSTSPSPSFSANAHGSIHLVSFPLIFFLSFSSSSSLYIFSHVLLNFFTFIISLYSLSFFSTDPDRKGHEIKFVSSVCVSSFLKSVCLKVLFATLCGFLEKTSFVHSFLLDVFILNICLWFMCESIGCLCGFLENSPINFFSWIFSSSILVKTILHLFNSINFNCFLTHKMLNSKILAIFL